MFFFFFSFLISLFSSSSSSVIVSLFKVFQMERLYKSLLACFPVLFCTAIRPKTIILFSTTSCIFFRRIVWTSFSLFNLFFNNNKMNRRE